MVDEPSETPTVTALLNGPYLVDGRLPLYRRRAVYSEHGEPLTWETGTDLSGRDRYRLCRCGQSSSKPFCDGTHAKVGFTSADTASGIYEERSQVLGGTGITVRDDRSICVHAGFCGSRVTNVWKEVPKTGDSSVRAHVIAMVERCPSGALTYRIETSGDVEPFMPAAAAVIDDGPIWLTGRVRVSMSDGREVEVRNRVTLCRCGGSSNKPLCDGSHKALGFTDS
jgi:CDGSH-type Zn-finger protein